MDVAVLGVPEDHAALVAVPVEQLGQLLRRSAAAARPGPRRPPAARSCRTAGPGDRGVQALADVPQRGPGAAGRRLSSPGSASGSSVEHRQRRGDLSRSSRPRVGSWYSTSRRGVLDDGRAGAARSSRRGSDWPTRRLVASSSSTVAKPVSTRPAASRSPRSGRRRSAAPVAACGRHRHGAQRRLGDERRAFPRCRRSRWARIVDRRGRGRGTSSGRSPWCSSSRTAAGSRRPTSASPRTRSRSRASPAYSSGSAAAQPVVGVRRAGVDHGAARQHDTSDSSVR